MYYYVQKNHIRCSGMILVRYAARCDFCFCLCHFERCGFICAGYDYFGCPSVYCAHVVLFDLEFILFVLYISVIAQKRNVVDGQVVNIVPFLTFFKIFLLTKFVFYSIITQEIAERGKEKCRLQRK